MKKFIASEVLGKLQGKTIICNNAKNIDDACKQFHAEETIKSGEKFKAVDGGRIYVVNPVINGIIDYQEERVIRTHYYG